jgi:hypothetical protein
MQQCQNCKARLSCGCQKRVASDGKHTCTNCLPMYEKQLIEQRNKTNRANAQTPIVNSVIWTPGH